MLRQFNCSDNKCLCRDKNIALKSKNYVTTLYFDVATQNHEYQNLKNPRKKLKISGKKNAKQ